MGHGRWVAGDALRRAVLSALLAGAVLLGGCTAAQPPSAPVPAATPGRPAGAPAVGPGTLAAYVDVTIAKGSAPPPGLALVLAFVVAGPRGCTPTWGGGLPIDAPSVLRQVERWRADGHELRVSFGGQRGTELASRCRSAALLAAAYRRVVQAVRPAAIDLDVEGRTLGDDAGSRRRAAALRLLQADGDATGRPLAITLTLPAAASGLTAAGRAQVALLLSEGVKVSAVNAMTMNYGVVTPDAAEQALVVAASVHDTWQDLEPDTDDATLWRRVWVTPMIGRNDLQPEVFTPDDAARLATLAKARGLGGLAFWSLSRDRPCPARAKVVSSTCSGVDAPAGTYATLLSRFAART